MKNRTLTTNYLKSHRKKSGLTQRQLGLLLGYQDDAQVSRHERLEAAPLLASAFGYHVVFRVPLTALFPGVYDEVKEAVEERIAQLETSLQDSSVRGREAEAIAQTLTWLVERRNKNIEFADEL